MIVYFLADFRNSNYMSWINRIDKNSMDNTHIYIVEPQTYEKVVRKEQCYNLPVNILYNSAIDSDERASSFALKIDKNLVGILSDILKRIGITQIDAVLSIYKNISLEIACKEMQIPMKYFEISAIRDESYAGHTLCWLLDNPMMFSSKEDKKRYENFCKEINARKLKRFFNPEELMLGVIKSNKVLDMYKVHKKYQEKYDVGIALPRGFEECSGDWDKDKIIDAILDRDKTKSILIRPHPADLSKKEKDLVYDEDSISDVFGFVSKCRCVISVGSNIAFEAMLFGKQVIDLSDSYFSNKILNEITFEKNCTYDTQYLNYLFFCVYTPEELLFNGNYLRWRIESKPSEIEIYNYNQKFIIEKWIRSSISEIEQSVDLATLILERRMIEKDRTRENRINKLLLISQIDWDNAQIYICGMGVNTERIIEILENFGLIISAIVVMDENEKKDHSKYPVLYIGEMKLFESDVFFITPKTVQVQLIMLDKLVKIGVKNIITI